MQGGGGAVGARSSDETAPVANDDYYGVHAGMTLTVSADNGVVANDTDAEGDAIFATLVSGPTSCTLSLDDRGAFIYTPNDGFTGADTFTYQASDGQLDGNIATVTLNVHADNSPPVASDASFDLTHDQTLNIPLPADGVLKNATDSDGDPLTASVVSTPVHGTVTLAEDGTFTYQPDARFVGTDSFTYSAFDGVASSSPATVTINVINDAPGVENATYAVAHDRTLVIGNSGPLGSVAYDIDGDPVTLSLVSPPSNGTLTAPSSGGLLPPSSGISSSGSFDYTPNPGFTGLDSFTYKANDGFTDSAPATVTIVVYNSAPVARDDYCTIRHDTLFLVSPLQNDTDAEGDALTVELLSNPQHGTLVSAPAQTFSYRPDPGYVGTDSFLYKASDGLEESSIAQVTINIVGDAPLGRNDVYYVAPGGDLQVASPGVLVNDDPAVAPPPPGDTYGALTAQLVSGPANGQLTLNADGSFEYQPNDGFSGVDTFTYQLAQQLLDNNGAVVGLFRRNVAEVDIVVPSINLNVPGVAADQKITVGGFIPVNANNDNGSGILVWASGIRGPRKPYEIPALRDFDVPFKSARNPNGQAWFRDPDLVQVPVTVTKPVNIVLPGTFSFSINTWGWGKVRLWEDPPAPGVQGLAPEKTPLDTTFTAATLPNTIYIEGLDPSSKFRDILLTLRYTDNAGLIVSDSVRLTVTPLIKQFDIATGVIAWIGNNPHTGMNDGGLSTPMTGGGNEGAVFTADLNRINVNGTGLFVQNLNNMVGGLQLPDGTKGGFLTTSGSVWDWKLRRGLTFPMVDTLQPPPPPDYPYQEGFTAGGTEWIIEGSDSPGIHWDPEAQVAKRVDETTLFSLYLMWRFPGSPEKGGTVLYTLARRD
jgi:VCBS repeat-containing protein